MKHLIEFDLPDERTELRMAMEGNKFFLALVDFEEELRKRRKYTDIEMYNINEIVELFHTILRYRDVGLWE